MSELPVLIKLLCLKVFWWIFLETFLVAQMIAFRLILSFRIAYDSRSHDRTYNELVKISEGFRNPAIVENLFIESGLQPKSSYSFMSSSKGKYPQDEYAKELRQAQAGKMAFRWGQSNQNLNKKLNFFCFNLQIRCWRHRALQRGPTYWSIPVFKQSALNWSSKCWRFSCTRCTLR